METSEIDLRPIPRKLSAAIIAAVEDLKKVERNPKIQIVMNQWHKPITADDVDAGDALPYEVGQCAMCFAGAFISGTCKVPLNESVTAQGSGNRTDGDCVMTALDYIREGMLESAVYSWPFGGKRNRERAIEALRWIKIPSATPYSPSTKGKFKRLMRRYARILQEAGI